MPSTTDNPVNGVVVEVESPAEINHSTLSLVNVSLMKFTACIVSLLEPLSDLCIDYPPKIGESALNTPPAPFRFIISCLYAFADMKSQGSDFPFQTHPRSIFVAVTSLLVYGLASAVEYFISASRLGPKSVSAIVARLGRISCLCILVASLASLFYL